MIPETPATATATVTTEVAPARAVSPDADTDELALAARLRSAVTRLHRRLRQQTVGGLTPSQSSALTSIEVLGTPTLGELAAREAVQPPSMTRIVGALEAEGFVARTTDPEDRRVARVGLTAAGRRTLADIRSQRTAYLARRLHLLGDGERAALADLTALLERLEELPEP
jgi:DNA-binding MarR family transcriptional regulator